MIGLNIFLLFNSLLIVHQPWQMDYHHFFLQHARWPEDPASLALLENTTTLKTHLEYFALLVEKVRMWQKVAITHRRLYNERMKRAYSTNLRPPTKLGIGEFCYLRVPYLSTITSH